MALAPKLACAALTALLLAAAVNASAQNRGRGANPSSPRIGPGSPTGPKTADPESEDAIALFSRLCVSTRGDRARAAGILSGEDTAVEKMEPGLARQLENGKPGGIGWLIRMPLGEKLLVDYPAAGGCYVRAPRVVARDLEAKFRNLLDQFAADDQFSVRRDSDETRSVDAPKRPGEPPRSPENLLKTEPKMKLHILGYVMTSPGESPAELTVVTTDSPDVQIQGILSYDIERAKP